MAVLVAAASKHGATDEIAARIGADLGQLPIRFDDPNALRTGLAEKLVETTQAREHKLFAGKLDKGKLGLMEKAAVRGAHAVEGDYRDWQAVDDWAATIAQELQQTREK